MDLVIVFLEANFHSNTTVQQRQKRYSVVRDCAAKAGLTGEVVAVWQDDFGRSRFIAPPEQHRFFQAVNYDQLYAQKNCTLNCDTPIEQSADARR